MLVLGTFPMGDNRAVSEDEVMGKRPLQFCLMDKVSSNVTLPPIRS